MKAIITNVVTGEKINVTSTSEHPSSSYGREVWVDDDNVAYMQVGLEHLVPLYTIEVVEQ